MKQAAGSVGGSIRRLAVSVAPGVVTVVLVMTGGRAVYHQCGSRIAFLLVMSKDSRVQDQGVARGIGDG